MNHLVQTLVVYTEVLMEPTLIPAMVVTDMLVQSWETNKIKFKYIYIYMKENLYINIWYIYIARKKEIRKNNKNNNTNIFI